MEYWKILIWEGMFIFGGHFKWRANKNKHGEGDNAYQIFVLNVINIEWQSLVYPEIIYHMAEETESVITQLYKESKLWVHSKLQQICCTSFSLTFSFKFTYICIADTWPLKRNILKENKKPFTAIKTLKLQ